MYVSYRKRFPTVEIQGHLLLDNQSSFCQKFLPSLKSKKKMYLLVAFCSLHVRLRAICYFNILPLRKAIVESFDFMGANFHGWLKFQKVRGDVFCVFLYIYLQKGI